MVIFGVADDGRVVGIEKLNETCLAIENKINDSIAPAPNYTLEPNAKNSTVVLTVEEGPHKPYYCKGKAYKRSDSSTVEVDQLELGRLVLLGRNMTFDEMKSRTDELTFTTLGKQLGSAMGVDTVNDDVLKSLELESPKGEFNIAAELLADANSFPGIDVARFGQTISIFRERATFEKESVLLQYDHTLDIYRRNYQYEEVNGAVRSTRDLIPEAAFREAIANALVHRQWDVPSHVRVSMFDDRVEVVLPGGLPLGLSEREYLGGQVSILRNPILGNVFFRLGIIERFGTGVLRIKDCYRESVTQPSFEIFENSIKVTLPLQQDIVALPEDEAIVYRIIEGRTLPISEISAMSGFGKSKTHGILKGLVKKGYAEIVGSGRGTKYKA